METRSGHLPFNDTAEPDGVEPPLEADEAGVEAAVVEAVVEAAVVEAVVAGDVAGVVAALSLESLPQAARTRPVAIVTASSEPLRRVFIVVLSLVV